jgi:hypothetical protein
MNDDFLFHTHRDTPEEKGKIVNCKFTKKTQILQHNASKNISWLLMRIRILRIYGVGIGAYFCM